MADNPDMARAYIGIGTNVGDRRGHIDLARRELASLPATTLVAFSPVYETAPVGPIEQGAFLNAAAGIDTELPPRELLQALRAIEAKAGREPREKRTQWGPRTLDLDILLYGEQVIRSTASSRPSREDDLTVPHPRMHERWFVLRPLADIAPDAVHPGLGVTVKELLERVEGHEATGQQEQ